MCEQPFLEPGWKRKDHGRVVRGETIERLPRETFLWFSAHFRKSERMKTARFSRSRPVLGSTWAKSIPGVIPRLNFSLEGLRARHKQVYPSIPYCIWNTSYISFSTILYRIFIHFFPRKNESLDLFKKEKWSKADSYYIFGSNTRLKHWYA